MLVFSFYLVSFEFCLYAISVFTYSFFNELVIPDACTLQIFNKLPIYVFDIVQSFSVIFFISAILLTTYFRYSELFLACFSNGSGGNTGLSRIQLFCQFEHFVKISFALQIIYSNPIALLFDIMIIFVNNIKMQTFKHVNNNLIYYSIFIYFLKNFTN